MREIRDAVASDAPALADVFFEAVRDGAAPHYTSAERQAWCPARPQPDRFWEGLKDQTILLASRSGRVEGFVSLTVTGCLDMLFVRPALRGTGLASALLGVLENRAMTLGHRNLTARASHMARPFLSRHGWTDVKPVAVTRNGVRIMATQMVRDLPCAATRAS